MDLLSLVDKALLLTRRVSDEAERAKAHIDACGVLGRQVSFVGKVLKQEFVFTPDVDQSFEKQERWSGDAEVLRSLSGLRVQLESALELISFFSDEVKVVKYALAKSYNASFRNVSMELDQNLLSFKRATGFVQDGEAEDFYETLQDALRTDAGLVEQRIDDLDDESMKEQMKEHFQQMVVEFDKVSLTPSSAGEGGAWRPRESWFLEPDHMKWETELRGLRRNLIGAGSFGSVHRGTLGTLPVAVKELHAGNSDEIEALRTDMECMYYLTHPHVVQTYGAFYPVAGEEDHLDERPFIAMELVPNKSLATYLEEQEKMREAGLSTRELVRIMKEAASGLQYLHSQRIIHRDVKPGNILLDGKFRAVVSDFGLTKHKLGANYITIRPGTLSYDPPEAATAGVRSYPRDVWNFGMTLYYVICGRHPFAGMNPAAALKALLDGDLRLSELDGAAASEFPEEVRDLARRCLRMEQEERPTMDVIVQELELVLTSMDGEDGSAVAKEEVEQIVVQDSSGEGEEAFQTGLQWEEAGDFESAGLCFIQAAAAGHVDGMFRFGMMLLDGSHGAEQNPETGLWWVKECADRGSVAAQAMLGEYFESGRETCEKNEATAVQWYRKAAEQGYVYAQMKMAYCYGFGIGLEQNQELSAEWLRKAAELGDAFGQSQLGFRYKMGIGVPKDAAKALLWYRKAAEQGQEEAQNHLGECYENGVGVPKDEAKAVAWYLKAAEQGNAMAQRNLAMCYGAGVGVETDADEAAKWLREAAEQGDEGAQLGMAMCYEAGDGVEQDEAEMISWYRKAAEQGNAPAQNLLGSYYEEGVGVEQDQAEAASWFRKAAEQGYPEAQMNLALCYGGSGGVEKDGSKAVMWLQKAAEQGFAGAQLGLGVIYENGEAGVEKDSAKAVAWYQGAAEQGDEDAQLRLASCYERGVGVQKDWSKAVMWYEKAAAQGNTMAESILSPIHTS